VTGLVATLASLESVLRSPALAVAVTFPLVVVLLLGESARIAPSQFRFGGATRAVGALVGCAFVAVVIARFVVLSF
jgi:hypothetical protein